MTTTLRSNKTLTSYVTTVDRINALAAQLKALELIEKNLRPDVLNEIRENDGRRAVIVKQIPRILTIEEKVSISQKLDDAETVDAARQIGLTVSTRSAEYVAPATLRTAFDRGEIGEELIEVKTTEMVKLT